MSGWVSLTLADGRKIAAETPGETYIDIAKAGYPARLAFSAEGLLAVQWTAEEPDWAPGDGRPPWVGGPLEEESNEGGT